MINFSHTLRKLSRIHFESSHWWLVPIQVLVCHRQSQLQPKITDKIVVSASASETKMRKTFRDRSTISTSHKKATFDFLFSLVLVLFSPEMSLFSSTLKLTLGVFLRESFSSVHVDEFDLVSVVIVAGAMVIGGTKSELNTISASL